MANISRFTSPNLVVAHAWPHKHLVLPLTRPPPPPSSLSNNDLNEAAEAALRVAGSKLKKLEL